MPCKARASVTALCVVTGLHPNGKVARCADLLLEDNADFLCVSDDAFAWFGDGVCGEAAVFRAAPCCCASDGAAASAGTTTSSKQRRCGA